MVKKTSEEIMREADALIEQAGKSLAAAADFHRNHGPALRALEDEAGARYRAEAEALFLKDIEDIERAVAEEAARLGSVSADPRAGGPRKMRDMI